VPFVFVNMAMTADGKIATANRRVSSFGSSTDKHHLLVLRSRADAVMAGARTVDLNPVNLGPGAKKYRAMRLNHGLAEYNIRVIVSGRGTIDPGAEIFRRRLSPIIVLTTERIPKTTLKQLRTLGATVEAFGRTSINFTKALTWLRQEWGIKKLLCEGGGELNSALFAEGLVNELHLTICPKIFGGRGAPTIVDGAGVKALAEATFLKVKLMRRAGDELFLVYDVFRPSA